MEIYTQLQSKTLNWQICGNDIFYQNNQFSQFSLSFPDILYTACSKNGGPFAIFRSDSNFYIYNQNGKLLLNSVVFFLL